MIYAVMASGHPLGRDEHSHRKRFTGQALGREHGAVAVLVREPGL